MMTSIVSDQARVSRDRALPLTTQTTQPQKQIQATAEQMRLAQVIYDKNDADFEDKVKQLMEVTGRNQDECMVALHDCNEDVNRAINFLLEGVTDKNSWETVGKKRGLGKEGTSAENKDNREKRGEREAGRGRGGPNRRARGVSRPREVRLEENGFDVGLGERGADRGRRGRGRGSAGRGRAGGVNRYSSQGMGTFNPADYNANSGTSYGETGEFNEGAGTWRNYLEDWTAEDWNEDLSETKVFTSSAALATENRVTPGHGADLASLLPKAPGGDGELEPCSAEGLGQSLVFTNSQHHNGRPATHSYAHATANSYAHAAASSYPHAALSSVLGSSFGGLSGSKPVQSEMQRPEHLNGPRLGSLSTQPTVARGNSSSTGRCSGSAAQMSAPVPANEAKTHSPAAASHLDLKAQPEPSAVLGQLVQQQQQQQQQQQHLPPIQPDLPAQARVPTPPGHEALPPPCDGPPPGSKLLAEAPIAEPPQQRQLKTQRRKVAPPSKIPSSAVEMPGSADISGLNVQFGALDFGSEPAAVDLGQPETSSRELAPAPPPQSSLFSKPSPISEPLSSLPSLPPSALDPGYPSPSLGLPTATGPPSSAGSRVESAGPRGVSAVAFPQSKDATTAPLTNGFSDVRTSSTQDSVSSVSRIPKPQPSPLPSEIGSACSAPSPAPTPTYSTAPPPLSSHVTSTHLSVSAASTSSSLIIPNEGNVSLSAFSTGPMVSATNTMVNSTNGLHGMGAPGLTANGTSAPSIGRTAPLLAAASGKAPPNLAQGVPPLLANQYIMGPGGLLPAYPIYGYEDLQMMQSRLPMEYYGVPFPGTTATLQGRDGGLANNPYSGEATKFGRGESASPAPPGGLSAGPPSQSQQQAPPQSQGQSQAPTQGQQSQNQAFLNPPLPPGYGYAGLPYYTGMPGVPSAFQYGPTVFMPPTSAKQPALGLGNPSGQYQHQPAAYGPHTYASGFDDLPQAHGGAEYGKGGYGGSSQAQAKSAGGGPGKGLSGSSTGGVPDMSASVYGKAQSFDKQGFHTGTPPPFSLPSALGGTGPLNPGGAPGYAPGPFLHILPAHQQLSQLLHHHLAQDAQGVPGQRGQSSSMQQKNQGNKSSYSNSPYWAN